MIIGNENAIERAKKLFETTPCNAVFLGDKGLGKFTFAKELISGFPDSILMDGKDFDTEASNVLLTKLSIVPLTEKKRVVLFDNANSISATVQNKLLKVVEEGQRYNVFLFVAHEPMLPTIMSRCMSFVFYPLDEIQIDEFLCGVSEEQKSYFRLVCGGTIGSYYRVRENEELGKALGSVYEMFSKGTASSVALLRAFGMVNEKSTAFENLLPDMDLCLGFLSRLWTEMMIGALGLQDTELFVPKTADIGFVHESLLQAINQYRKGLFTKQEFFKLLQMMGGC